MATAFLYLGIAAAIAAIGVLGVGLRQMVRERRTTYPRAVFTIPPALPGWRRLLFPLRRAGVTTR
jgi:hypothetical protein